MRDDPRRRDLSLSGQPWDCGYDQLAGVIATIYDFMRSAPMGSSVQRLHAMKWLDTSEIADIGARESAFWAKHRADLASGQFWADRIATYRDEPIKRLQLALENLPLPAAFREAAIAIRALIRRRAKAKQDSGDELVLLYWLAAIESFGTPYSEHLKQPGYNVLVTVPGSVIKALPFTYRELGYRNLAMLNKTDIRWCVDRWGEPTSHTTLNALHAKVWHQYERELKDRQDNERQAFWGFK